MEGLLKVCSSFSETPVRVKLSFSLRALIDFPWFFLDLLCSYLLKKSTKSVSYLDQEWSFSIDIVIW